MARRTPRAQPPRRTCKSRRYFLLPPACQRLVLVAKHSVYSPPTADVRAKRPAGSSALVSTALRAGSCTASVRPTPEKPAPPHGTTSGDAYVPTISVSAGTSSMKHRSAPSVT